MYDYDMLEESARRLNKQNLAQEIETTYPEGAPALDYGLNKQNLAQEIETMRLGRRPLHPGQLEQTESRSRD